ncbi:hypothetical protein ABIA06_002888 [Bradyrhizobium yuanmingense]|uniref:hypothetical protein n=1 Tax=Bradyrhizobium TaxID=374 RepID=UPI000D670758|nr:hypothetical protein [Bradyrhizobium sp. SUTN9-2]PWE77309.1 hypothetical protein XF30_11650 [Bradyrhizobium sp. SUTN9-2]
MTKAPLAKADQHIENYFEERARSGDGAFAIAYALLELRDAQIHTARALNKLGVGDASTHFGAIENLAMEIKDAARVIAEIGSAITESGSTIADAISQADADG